MISLRVIHFLSLYLKFSKRVLRGRRRQKRGVSLVVFGQELLRLSPGRET